jgi:hypothetical protein
MVGGIIAKLPPSWKYFSMSLQHKKETMTVESLITFLDVEEKAKSKDMPRSIPQKGTSNANVVGGGANLVVVTRTIRTGMGRPNKTLILRRRGTRRTLLALCVVSLTT